ncbi:hypothetical protein Pcinc_011441 [Petrolisthes cinctipes]|uniref:Regulatory protein zeste n=1 Tax=Petrolisthes cinctipes TaxID=88211 RepID=A0AAE1G2P6_PETCI|nr:hypothetical protein Pcinc_011441 [Petrolisthes cinctipes]
MEQVSPGAASTPVKEKRVRKSNWTLEESRYLLQLYAENIQVMRSDFSVQGCNRQNKQMAWDTIRRKLQQAFPAGKRTVKECQKRWHTILMTSRPKLAQVNKDFAATGKKFGIHEG